MWPSSLEDYPRYLAPPPSAHTCIRFIDETPTVSLSCSFVPLCSVLLYRAHTHTHPECSSTRASLTSCGALGQSPVVGAPLTLSKPGHSCTDRKLTSDKHLSVHSFFLLFSATVNPTWIITGNNQQYNTHFSITNQSLNNLDNCNNQTSGVKRSSCSKK